MPNSGLPDPPERDQILADDFAIDYIYVRSDMQRIREMNPDKYPNYAAMADKARISESWLKKFFAGDILNPKCNTMYQLCSTFGIDIRKAMHLLPKNPRNERDETMLELRHQIVRLEDQLEKQTCELSGLRETLSSTSASKIEAETRAAALAVSEARLNRQLCRHRWIMLGLFLAVIAVFAYIAWEVANPTKGLIQLHYEHLTK